MQSLLKILNKDIGNNQENSEENSGKKYELYRNLYNFIEKHYEEVNRESYFFLVRNFYKTYVIGNIYNNIMIFKNNLYILDDYYKHINNLKNLNVTIQLSDLISNINFNYGEILSNSNQELSVKHFILNYYGKQKNKKFNFINLNSILDLFQSVENKEENEENTGQLKQVTIYRFGSFVFEAKSKNEEVKNEGETENKTENKTENETENETEDKDDIEKLIDNSKNILNLVKSQIMLNDNSININFFDYNQSVSNHLLNLFGKEYEGGNLFDFGFMIENSSQCDNITNILNNIYINSYELNKIIKNLINVQTLKDFILMIIKIIIYYIKIETYLFYSYLYWNKDIELCKEIMEEHENS